MVVVFARSGCVFVRYSLVINNSGKTLKYQQSHADMEYPAVQELSHCIQLLFPVCCYTHATIINTILIRFLFFVSTIVCNFFVRLRRDCGMCIYVNVTIWI